MHSLCHILRTTYDYQIKTLEEYEDCKTTIDKVSQFGLRPPELLFITDIEFYYRQFSFEKLKPSEIHKALHQELTISCWLDARGNQVKLRRQAFQMFLSSCVTKSQMNDNINHTFLLLSISTCSDTTFQSN